MFWKGVLSGALIIGLILVSAPTVVGQTDAPGEVVKAYSRSAYGGNCDDAMNYCSSDFVKNVTELAGDKSLRELYARICPPGKNLEKIEITREKIFGNDALVTYVLGFSGGEKRQETASLIKLQSAWKIVKISSR